jgi:putative flavoprotein involved in K+ transport
VSLVVIGGGQAGLAVSHELRALGIEHVVLERDHVAETWRRRWDSFRLVTPNWTLDLPDAPYAGDDPEGFAPREEIVDYLEQYAADLPVHTGVAVDGLEHGPAGGFLLRTSVGQRTADTVVVCTGAYQRPHRPPVSGEFPRDLAVLDAEGYRNPAALPAGRVLVVGSGQTGCQIAEELCRSGREVFLACGRAPWGPRRPAGRDIVTWLNETTWFRTPASALPAPAARLFANIQTTGKDGGHDLHYRTLQAMGVELFGRLAGVDGHHVRFADDLVAW